MPSCRCYKHMAIVRSKFVQNGLGYPPIVIPGTYADDGEKKINNSVNGIRVLQQQTIITRRWLPLERPALHRGLCYYI